MDVAELESPDDLMRKLNRSTCGYEILGYPMDLAMIVQSWYFPAHFE